jgi:DNA-binding NarL/FixJ family response regulator
MPVIVHMNLLAGVARASATQAWPQLTVLARARNGREAVEQFEAHRPDVCFIDVHMPGMCRRRPPHRRPRACGFRDGLRSVCGAVWHRPWLECRNELRREQPALNTEALLQQRSAPTPLKELVAQLDAAQFGRCIAPSWLP